MQQLHLARRAKTTTKTKSASCTRENLQTLQREYETLRNGDSGRQTRIGSTLALSELDAQAIVSRFTIRGADQSITTKANRIAYGAPYPSWESDLGAVCALYSAKTAESICVTNWACGYYAYGLSRVNTRSADYLRYHKTANDNCFQGFQGLVASREQNKVNTNQNSNSNQSSNSGSTEGAEDPRVNGDSRITELENQIRFCRDSLRASEKETAASDLRNAFIRNCRAANGDTADSEPLVCMCPQGEQMPFDGRSAKACPDYRSEDRSSSLPPPQTSSDNQIIHPPQPQQRTEPPVTSTNPPAGGSCQCTMQNGSCVKVVDGRVVVSKTPFYNPKIGKQEICDPSRSGGYENLCNQPDMRCP